MDLEHGLTPAVLTYEGLQYQHMAPEIFTEEALSYIEEHLRILSGFYGILKPFDGVTPYRLEMQAKLSVNGKKDLYDFWGSYIEEHLRILSGFYGILKPFDGVTPYRLEMQAKLSVNGKKDLYDFWGERLYLELISSDSQIINLASKEYSKAIEKYLTPKDSFITVEFCELREGKLKQKATLAKMARGEMVRFMAENKIQKPEGMKEFHELGFAYKEVREGKLKQKATLAKMARGEMVRFMAENKIQKPEGMKEFHELGFAYKEEYSNERKYIFVCEKQE